MKKATKTGFSTKDTLVYTELAEILGRIAVGLPRWGALADDIPQDKPIEILQFDLDGTLNGDHLAAIARFCKRCNIAFWGVDGHPGMNGILFFDVTDFKHPQL